MNRILSMFIIYPSCEGALRKERMKSKIVRKWYFGNTIFLTSHDYIWLFFICFLYCAKEGIVVEISKVSQPLEKSLTLCKGSRINFPISPYCTLLFSRKENFKFWKLLYQLFFAMARLATLWMCDDISIEILPIPHWTFTHFSKTAIKALKQGLKFVQT